MVGCSNDAAVLNAAVLIFMTDRDAEPFTQMRVQDILHELLFLQHEQDFLHPLHIMEFRLLQELRRAAQVQALALLKIQGPSDDLHRRLIERFIHDFIADVLEAALLDCIQGLPGQALIDDLRHALEISEFRTGRHFNDLVLHKAGIRHDDGNHPVAVQRQKLQAAERGLGNLRCQHQRDILRHAGNDLGCLLKDFLDPLDSGPIPAVNDLFFMTGHRLRRKKIIYIKAIALRGGNPPGRCVQLLEVAQHLQIRHFIANRCRTHTQIVFPGNGTRAHGLRRGNIIINDRLQNPLLTFIEHSHTSRC